MIPVFDESIPVTSYPSPARVTATCHLLRVSDRDSTTISSESPAGTLRKSICHWLWSPVHWYIDNPKLYLSIDFQKVGVLS